MVSGGGIHVVSDHDGPFTKVRHNASTNAFDAEEVNPDSI
jgi:hypothetical protein